MSNQGKLLTTEEVAEILRVQPRTVQSYIAQKKLPAVDLEGSYRIYQRDLDEFISQRYKRPEPKTSDPSGQAGSAF